METTNSANSRSRMEGNLDKDETCTKETQDDAIKI